jgi:hypothetical protein
MQTTYINRQGRVTVLPEHREKDFSYLEESSLIKIPEEVLPLAVLSYTASSPFAFGIINVRKGIWNHFMWMHRPGMFASQGWSYEEVPIQNYVGFDKRLKFWHNPNWTKEDRFDLIDRIHYWLRQPHKNTRYDVLAILGQAINQVWIQNPLYRICSDYGSILRESRVDISYNLKHPAPDQVDKWFEANGNRYKVYGRYAGE